ncbi:hypothetical protein SCP_0106050 [Sparassis crispa]|uniref:Uncharacterized protein n=1 Tax=Sparassis crispa TaxID=139825 RepID=A0A401G6D4_9APHY|nr:hypothetical protein SCP_0106050 [Sparassis crispa]GBE77723.1 hypothetical protein SCP_0106050 [Sparassis crispa]
MPPLAPKQLVHRKALLKPRDKHTRTQTPSNGHTVAAKVARAHHVQCTARSSLSPFQRKSSVQKNSIDLSGIDNLDNDDKDPEDIPEDDSDPEEEEILRKKHLGDQDYTDLDPATRRKRLHFENTMDDLSRTGKVDKGNRTLMTYHRGARYIPRGIGPFVNPMQAIQLGLRAYQHVENSDDNDDNMDDNDLPEELSENQRQELEYAYKAILDIIPGLKVDIDLFEEDPSAVHILANYLDAHLRSTRSDDIASLKARMINYIPRLDGYPILNSDDPKWERGFVSITTGRQLCSQILLQEFDEDPVSFCRRVRDGETRILSDDYPSFLYDQAEYDPDELDAGLLKGPLLVACFKSLFTGPRTVKNTGSGKQRGPGRPPLAQIYQLSQVSSRNLAYVAVLVHFVLNG